MLEQRESTIVKLLRAVYSVRKYPQVNKESIGVWQTSLTTLNWPKESTSHKKMRVASRFEVDHAQQLVFVCMKTSGTL
jgi:hypothetical protein